MTLRCNLCLGRVAVYNLEYYAHVPPMVAIPSEDEYYGSFFVKYAPECWLFVKGDAVYEETLSALSGAR